MKYMTKYISALLSLVLCFVFTYPAMIKQVQEQKQIDIQEQLDRIEQLEKDYKSGNYTKVDENSFCDFDLDKACADGVKYNHKMNEYAKSVTQLLDFDIQMNGNKEMLENK